MEIAAAIQPHGLLVVLDPLDLRVLHVSENAETLTGVPATDWLGASFVNRVASSQRADVRRLTEANTLDDRNPFFVGLGTDEAPRYFEAVAHRRGAHLLVELEPFDENAPTGSSLLRRARNNFETLLGTKETKALANAVASTLREVTGFDRAFVVQFDGTGTGNVIADEHREGLDSFDGLCFPAADFPPFTRELLTTIRVRYCADLAANPSPLVSEADASGSGPVDLAHTSLRRITPADFVFLNALGARGGLVLALAEGSRLWGLLVGMHEEGPRVLTIGVRDAAALLADTAASLFIARELALENTARATTAATLQAFERAAQSEPDAMRALMGASPTLLDVIEANGAAVRFRGNTETRGTCPPLTQLEGALVVPLSDDSVDFLLWHRTEPKPWTAAERSTAAALAKILGPIARGKSRLPPHAELEAPPREPKLPPLEARAPLSSVARLAEHMEGLVDMVQRFTRVTRLELVLEEVAVDSLIASLVDKMGAAFDERNVILRIPRPLPKVRADRERLGDVFAALLSNAMLYNDKAERWIEVGSLDPKPNKPPILFVRDNGIGIPEEEHASLFRLFHRLPGSETFGPGNGAGLSLAKRIVERHGGRLWLESQPGQGSTFYFTC